MKSARFFAFVLLIAIFALPGFGDVILLRDGRKISGTMSLEDQTEVITADDGTVTRVSRGDVLKVKLTKSVSPADAAQAQWDRTKAEITAANDLKTILSLHQAFLAKYGNQPATVAAKNSLIQFQKLAGENAIKFHGKWMPASQAEATQLAWDNAAYPALRAYNANDPKDALAAANIALKGDSQNPTARALLGLAAHQLNNLALAQQSFKALLEADPNDVIALNNLAVLAFEQKTPTIALRDYAQALQAGAGNRLLLDNIAQARELFADKRDSNFLHLNALYQKAEKAIEPVMANQGLHRWGAVWVTQAQLNAMQSHLQTLEHQMAQMESKYDADKSTVANLDAAILENSNEYYAAQSDEDPDQWAADTQRLMQEANALNAQRADAAAVVSDDEEKAKPIQQDFTDARQLQFPGVQRLMQPGEDKSPPPPAVVKMPN